jgi:hypothetical protein
MVSGKKETNSKNGEKNKVKNIRLNLTKTSITTKIIINIVKITTKNIKKRDKPTLIKFPKIFICKIKLAHHKNLLNTKIDDRKRDNAKANSIKNAEITNVEIMSVEINIEI